MLPGPRRELGPRSALSGTVSGSNSLNRHRYAVILGISPLALSRFAPSWSVEMTDFGSSVEPKNQASTDLAPGPAIARVAPSVTAVMRSKESCELHRNGRM
jgi:hypothetical protein